MGNQIIKQPNGKYAVFSTNVDGFLFVNVTPKEIIEAYVANERLRITASVTAIVDELNKGKKPYYQFTLTWEEALKEHEEYHGKLEIENAT